MRPRVRSSAGLLPLLARGLCLCLCLCALSVPLPVRALDYFSVAISYPSGDGSGDEVSTAWDAAPRADGQPDRVVEAPAEQRGQSVVLTLSLPGGHKLVNGVDGTEGLDLDLTRTLPANAAGATDVPITIKTMDNQMVGTWIFRFKVLPYSAVDFALDIRLPDGVEAGTDLDLLDLGASSFTGTPRSYTVDLPSSFAGRELNADGGSGGTFVITVHGSSALAVAPLTAAPPHAPSITLSSTAGEATSYTFKILAEDGETDSDEYTIVFYTKSDSTAFDLSVAVGDAAPVSLSHDVPEDDASWTIRLMPEQGDDDATLTFSGMHAAAKILGLQDGGGAAPVSEVSSPISFTLDLAPDESASYTFRVVAEDGTLGDVRTLYLRRARADASFELELLSIDADTGQAVTLTQDSTTEEKAWTLAPAMAGKALEFKFSAIPDGALAERGEGESPTSWTAMALDEQVTLTLGPVNSDNVHTFRVTAEDETAVHSITLRFRVQNDATTLAVQYTLPGALERADAVAHSTNQLAYFHAGKNISLRLQVADGATVALDSGIAEAGESDLDYTVTLPFYGESASVSFVVTAEDGVTVGDPQEYTWSIDRSALRGWTLTIRGAMEATLRSSVATSHSFVLPASAAGQTVRLRLTPSPGATVDPTSARVSTITLGAAGGSARSSTFTVTSQSEVSGPHFTVFFTVSADAVVPPQSSYESQTLRFQLHFGSRMEPDTLDQDMYDVVREAFGFPGKEGEQLEVTHSWGTEGTARRMLRRLLAQTHVADVTLVFTPASDTDSSAQQLVNVLRAQFSCAGSHAARMACAATVAEDAGFTSLYDATEKFAQLMGGVEQVTFPLVEDEASSGGSGTNVALIAGLVAGIGGGLLLLLAGFLCYRRRRQSSHTAGGASAPTEMYATNARPRKKEKKRNKIAPTPTAGAAEAVTT